MIYIYCDHPVFVELSQQWCHSLLKLGYDCQLCTSVSPHNFLDLYVMFGMNNYQSKIVPTNYIVMQLEQTTGNSQSQWFSQTYINYLNNALLVCEYSLVNYRYLKQQLSIKKIEYVPIGLLDIITPLSTVNEINKDIDILLLGSMCDRRQYIIDQFKQKYPNLNIVCHSNIWGSERQNILQRTKLVLNVHYYNESILETVRLTYLLSLGIPVLSENSLDPLLDRMMSTHPLISLTTYDDLVNQYQRWDINAAKVTATSTATHSIPNYHNSIETLMTKVSSVYEHLCGKRDVTKTETQTQTLNLNELKVITDSNDIAKAVTEITPNQELVLKLPKYTDEELPYISIITCTYNRQHLFPMAVRNYQLTTYPKHKIEWIIVDDSDNASDNASGDLNSLNILPKYDKNIKYYKLTTTGRLSIGQKRNFAVSKATHDIIICMDDDDYYYPLSFYARTALLLAYPQYDLVGVCELDIYDALNNFSARINSPYVSEASMAFRKSFWEQCQFPDKFSTLGEGVPFTTGRRHKILKMPSCFNLIAITHKTNYTQDSRSQSKFQHVKNKSNLLSILDTSTKLFILNLFAN